MMDGLLLPVCAVRTGIEAGGGAAGMLDLPQGTGSWPTIARRFARTYRTGLWTHGMKIISVVLIQSSSVQAT